MLRRDRAFGKSKGAIAQDGQTPSLANGQRVNALSDLSANLGTVRYARILVGTGELGTDYTGVVITDDGVFYEGHYWHIAGLNNEVLQVGISADDGTLYAGAGAVVLDEDGLHIVSGDTDQNRLNFIDGDTDGVLGYVGDYLNPNDAFHTLTLQSSRAQLAAEYGGGYVAGRLVLLVESSAGVQDYLELYNNDLAWTGALLVGSTGSAGPTGTIKAAANLIAGADVLALGEYTIKRGGTTYTVSPPVQFATPLTSTSWDGDAKTTADNGVIDLSAVFGVPAGVKSVKVKVIGSSATVNRYFGVGAASGNNVAANRVAVANQNAYIGPVDCPCDANGDIWFYCDGDMTAVHIQIFGYSW